MAEKLIDKAIMLNPNESTFLTELLRFKRKTGKLAEARKLLVEKKMACSDESCHKEYSEELDRQNLIELMAKQLE